MIAYVNLGTDDLDRAVRFYDALLEPIGFVRFHLAHGYAGYRCGDSPAAATFWVNRPFDGQRASPGNGAMVAFAAATPDAVRAFHARALAAGGTSEGAPGPMPDYAPDWYAAYVRDADGNKLACYCRGAD